MQVGDNVWAGHPGDPEGSTARGRRGRREGRVRPRPRQSDRDAAGPVRRRPGADPARFKLAPLPPALAGAWRLTEWQQHAGGSGCDPLGAGAAGLLLCHPSGAISFQLIAPEAHLPYAGLFGRGAVRDAAEGADGLRGQLIVAVEGVHPPGFSDDGAPRPFHLDGDALTLGDGATWRRTLTRIPG